MATTAKASCPYGTYQRAIHGHHLRTISNRLLIKLVRARFAGAARRDPACRESRKIVYRGALKHLQHDLDILRDFRL